MALGGKLLDTIGESDLQELIRNEEPEGRTIDYKLTLPGKADNDRREFLHDMSSFANAIGGHVIYGMAEEGGLPIDLPGLPDINPDAEIRRLDSLAQSAINPRIYGLTFKDVRLRNGAVAIIARIPKSLIAPHMVTFQGSQRFFSRNSRGKYPMDVTDLRVAFTSAGQLADQMRAFRLERVGRIIAGDTPLPLRDQPKAILHLVPFSAFDIAAQLDTMVLARGWELWPLSAGSHWLHRHNFDGLITYDGATVLDGTLNTRSYLQLFRGGSIETTSADLIYEEQGRRVIYISDVEEQILTAIPRYLAFMAREGLQPPLFLMLSVVGIEGYRIHYPGVPASSSYRRGDAPIDRDVLLLPESLIERFDIDPAVVMRSSFDALWNAAGWPRSLNYDSEGKWVRIRQ